MKTEFEIKFYPIDKTKVRKKLSEVGAKLLLKESLMKISLFGNTSNNDMKVHYIRVRDEIDKITLSAKVHAREGESINEQKETQVNVSNFDDTVNILKLAGLVMDYDQEKYREIWNLNNCEIVIDTWPNLKPILEIEGESESMVRAVADQVGFDWDDGVFTSITEIVASEKNVSFDEALRLTTNWKFND